MSDEGSKFKGWISLMAKAIASTLISPPKMAELIFKIFTLSSH